MQKLRTALLAAILAIAGATQAVSQSFPITMPANTIYGRLGTSSGPGSAIPLSTISSYISASLTVGGTAISGGTSGRILYDNAGVLGEATVTGTLGSVVLSNTPTLVTPILGVATGTSLALNGCTITSLKFCVTGDTTVSGNTSVIGLLGVGSAGATALAVGPTGSTNPTFQVDASAPAVAGLKVTGAVTGGTVAIAAIDSGSNASLSIDAKGTGTITIGGTSTGNIIHSRASTFATTVAIAGCTIGSDALCITGSATFSSTLATAAHTITSTSANALAVGRQGATNPVLQVDASTATVATGLKVKGAAAAGGLALSVITSGTNENLTLDAAGSGTITVGGTSTGAITLSRATTASVSISSPIHQSSGSMTINTNGSTFAALINTSQQLIYGANQTVGATPTVIITKNGSSVTNPIYSNAMLQMVNVDGTGTQIAMDAYGAAVSNGIQVRHARGTQASPTATQSADTLWSFVANGYYVTGGPAFGTLDSIFSLEALENFTSTARGTTWRFYTTAAGATGAAQRVQVASGLSVGTSTDPGVGRLLLTSYAQTGTTTVGALPTCNAGTKGARFFVTDANANTFHTTAAAGGANNVGVTCDGTNWYISANDNIPAHLLRKFA